MKSGYEQFSELCSELINIHPFLQPMVWRTKSSEWTAQIKTRPEGDRIAGERLASAQGMTMEECCQNCVEDYNKRIEVLARKEELLRDPKVREALELFQK